MPTVKLKCLKYYRSAAGLFWQPGDVYEFDYGDVYEFVVNFLADNNIEVDPAETSDAFILEQVGLFYEYFEPVDSQKFNKVISGKWKDEPVAVAIPERIPYRGLTLSQLIARLLEIQEQVGGGAKVIALDGDHDWWDSVDDVSVETASEFQVRRSDVLEQGETFVMIDF